MLSHTGQIYISDNTVVSTSNQMYLEFSTNDLISFPGFKIRFYGVHNSRLPMSSRFWKSFICIHTVIIAQKESYSYTLF